MVVYIISALINGDVYIISTCKVLMGADPVEVGILGVALVGVGFIRTDRVGGYP